MVPDTGMARSGQWHLRLYIAGQTPRCLKAMDNLRKICENYFRGRYRIEIIDLIKDPRLAEDDGILAIPTLVKRQPDPANKIIGDLSDTEEVLSILNSNALCQG